MSSHKNILVVEDNDVNLELITLLIKQYAQEHAQPIDLFTAVNGQQAVDLCNQRQFDIIFMDLMMPTMNGSEATKIIKTNHPKTMIIVISAFGDEAKQKEMLRNGAEDYMIKPVNAALFKSRLHNYLQLIQNRNHISSKPRARNLFTSKVFNYYMDFTIATDADLSEFWEALLIRLDFQRHIDHLSDFVRFIYRLGLIKLQHKFQFHIIVEEDNDTFFFTLDHIQLIGCTQVNALLKRYYPQGVCLCKDNVLSFALQKSLYEETFQQPAHSDEHLPSPSGVSILTTLKDEDMKTFDILEADEREDFEDCLLRLRSLSLMMENSSLTSSDIDEICTALNSMAAILSISNDTYVISNALHELAHAILENQAYFIKSSAELFNFVNAFLNDLVFWKTKIFYEGAPSVDFLNDSISSNANMLHALLQPDSESDKDLDDIFDF